MVIVEVGSLNMDLVVRIPNIPKPGETLLGGHFHTYPGGKGANQAIAAARLGAQVHMIGCVGKDPFGAELRAILDAERVNSLGVLNHPEEATGVALIQVDANGQNSIAVASGANMCLNSEDVESTLRMIGDFDVLVMPLEIPIEVVMTAARIAASKRARIILNPAPALALEPAILQMVDMLVPNENEIEIISDVKIQSSKDLSHAADVLHTKGLKHLVVTLGNRGCLYSNIYSGEKIRIPAKPVKAVDTTAAGDCFIGGLAVGLCEDMDVVSALEFASVAAAISVTRFGAQPSLPYRDEVDEFMLGRRTK